MANGKFELTALLYEADALEPVISKETIGFHHGKHLLAYVNNLNGLIAESPLAGLPDGKLSSYMRQTPPILCSAV